MLPLLIIMLDITKFAQERVVSGPTGTYSYLYSRLTKLILRVIKLVKSRFMKPIRD